MSCLAVTRWPKIALSAHRDAMSASVTIEPFRAGFSAALVSMWRASFERGVGLAVPHPLADHRRFFEDHVLVETVVHVALRDGELVGFVSSTPEAVLQLYVHVDHLGEGIGTRLLDLAKTRSDGTLWLYTFATNLRAQRFYERRGFDIEERGFEPEIQLDDIRYRWARGVQRSA
jgi:ribosomal protein S18 acetylase RimI-like enzyme